MHIEKPGKYRLTEDFSTRGQISISRLSKGRILTITQIDAMHDRVIGLELEDWTRNDLPVEPIPDEINEV